MTVSADCTFDVVSPERAWRLAGLKACVIEFSGSIMPPAETHPAVMTSGTVSSHSG